MSGVKQRKKRCGGFLIRDNKTGEIYIGGSTVRKYTGVAASTLDKQLWHNPDLSSSAARWNFSIVANPTKQEYESAVCIGRRPTFEEVLYSTALAVGNVPPPKPPKPPRPKPKPKPKKEPDPSKKGVPAGSSTLCWDCKKATGFCAWSSWLEPVPGWNAIRTKRRDNDGNELDGFFVVECPEFIQDERS